MAGEKKKITIPEMLAAKKTERKLTMVTSYDYSTAVLVSGSAVDMILVGDSAAMVMLGHPGTVPITLDTLVTMAVAVVRGAGHNTFIIGDMPFLSYEVNRDKAIENCGRYLKEAGCDAVKLEGGRRVAATVAAIVRAGIPVMGHIGLTPQTASALGGFKAQGRGAQSALALLQDALAIEEAGVFAMALECVPYKVAEVITERVHVPTIGTGAGDKCDGQCLVLHDVFGLLPRSTPKHGKQYANLFEVMLRGAQEYIGEVRSGQFPDPQKNGFSIPEEELQRFLDAAKAPKA